MLTLAQYKTYAQITSSTEDSKLAMMVSAANASMMDLTGRNFTQTNYPGAVIDGKGDSGLYSGDGVRYLYTRQAPLLASVTPTLHYDPLGYFGDNPDGAFASATLLTLGRDYSIDWDGYLPTAASSAYIYAVLVGTVADTVVYSVVVNGTTFTATATGASTPTTIAAALATAIAANAGIAAVVTATSSVGTLTLTGVTAGVSFTVTASASSAAGSILASLTQTGSDGAGVKCSMTGRIELIGTTWQGLWVYSQKQLTPNLQRARGNLKLTYTAGWPVLPGDVTAALCQVVAWMRLTAQTGGLLSGEKYEDYSYTLTPLTTKSMSAQAMTQLASVQSVVAKYKRVAVV